MYSALKTHLPLIRTFAIIAILLFAGSGALSAIEQTGAKPTTLDSAKWLWSPASSWEEGSRPPDTGWRSYEEPVALEHAYFWLRVTLPRTAEFSDPSLFLLRMNDNRVYLDGQPVYASDAARSGVYVNNSFYWHLIELPLQLPDHVDLLLQNGSLRQLQPGIELGEKADFINRMLHNGIDNLILGSLLIFSCFVSLGLYASHRDKLYLYFALLTFSGGYASLVGNTLIMLLWHNPWISSLQETAMPWATFAVVGVLGQVFIGENKRTVRLLHLITLVFAAFVTLSLFVSLPLYTFSMAYLYTPIFLTMLTVAYWTIWKSYRSRKDIESIWVMAGFTSLVAVAFVHVVRYWLPPGLYVWWPGLKSYLTHLPEDFIYAGLFAFVVCLIRVIIHRYTAMNRELTEVNRSLEQLVGARIIQIQNSNRQLEEANERLSASLRESAEAMAETMMLEERHRITGAIHDTVGHTLSEAIVALDSARQLLLPDPEKAEEQIVQSQSHARKGLEGIRRSVRLLREDAGHFDLPGSMRALIRETEQMAGCRIECRIGSMPERLADLQKRVLFQALQEGLACGLKSSSGTRRFQFDLSADDGLIRFALFMDGQPAWHEGENLGLRIVEKRVAMLGGQFRMQPAPPGAALFLTVPESA